MIIGLTQNRELSELKKYSVKLTKKIQGLNKELSITFQLTNTGSSLATDRHQIASPFFQLKRLYFHLLLLLFQGFNSAFNELQLINGFLQLCFKLLESSFLI
jgi:hypothetical protein